MGKGLLACLALLSWLLIFLLGLTVDSTPYRNGLAGGTITIHNLVMAFLVYTVTNAAVLCLLSGAVGAMAHTILWVQPQGGDLTTSSGSGPSLIDALSAGALRSFAVFLLYISGVYVGASDAFVHTTAEQYARVIAATSLLTFVVSYNPAVFGRLLDRLLPDHQSRSEGLSPTTATVGNGVPLQHN